MVRELLFGFWLAAVSQTLLDSGRQAFESGDLVRAERSFREYLKDNPSSAEALSNLGAICSRREQFQEAVGFYQKALQSNPKLVPIHFNLAVALERLNQYAEAAKHLRVFLKTYPQEARAR